MSWITINAFVSCPAIRWRNVLLKFSSIIKFDNQRIGFFRKIKFFYTLTRGAKFSRLTWFAVVSTPEIVNAWFTLIFGRNSWKYSIRPKNILVPCLLKGISTGHRVIDPPLQIMPGGHSLHCQGYINPGLSRFRNKLKARRRMIQISTTFFGAL